MSSHRKQVPCNWDLCGTLSFSGVTPETLRVTQNKKFMCDSANLYRTRWRGSEKADIPGQSPENKRPLRICQDSNPSQQFPRSSTLPLEHHPVHLNYKKNWDVEWASEIILDWCNLILGHKLEEIIHRLWPTRRIKDASVDDVRAEEIWWGRAWGQQWPLLMTWRHEWWVWIFPHSALLE